jgi:PAS domain-containing protein
MDLKKYKNLFEQSSAAEIVIDTNFTIVSATNAFLNKTGTRREDITGKILFDIFPSVIRVDSDNEDSIRASIQRVVKKKTTDALTVALNDNAADHSENDNPDVKYRRIVHSPVFDENNEVEFIIQRMEGVYVQNGESGGHMDSNERFNRLIMQSHFGISVVKGEDMRIALANDLSKERLGIEEDVVGKKLLEVLPEMKDQPLPDLIRQVYTTGSHFQPKKSLQRFNATMALWKTAILILYYSPTARLMKQSPA